MPILLGNLIECSIIDTQSEFAVLLFNKHNRRFSFGSDVTIGDLYW